MFERLEFVGRAPVHMERYGLIEDEVSEVLLSNPSVPDNEVEDLMHCFGPLRRDTTLSIRFTVEGEVTKIIRVMVLERH